MKSKFFGLSAKLALAILAVGTSLTSCYDSENGDVTKPYVAPDAVYTIAGTVTTTKGEIVANTNVTLSGVLAGTTTTDEAGSYSIRMKIDGGAEGQVTVAVASTTFSKAVNASVNVEKILNGQAVTYYKNLVAESTTPDPEPEPEPDPIPDFSIDSSMGAEDNVYSGDEKWAEENGATPALTLDLLNDSSEPIMYRKNFEVLSGSKITKDDAGVFTASRAIPDDVIEKFKAKIINSLGVAPKDKFDTVTKPFEITLPGKTALRSVTVSYVIETKKFECSYGEETINVEVQSIVKETISYAYTTTENYHGHGHGHGDGDNVGGGEFTE